MQVRRLFLVLAAAIALLGAGWYVIGHRPSAAPTGTPQAKAQPVVTRVAESRAMPVRVTAVGNVQSLAVVAVRPRVEGEVIKVHIVEGQEVREGAPLFTLDFRAAEAAKRQAEASLARDRAQLDRARRDLDRYTQLLKSGSATPQKVEQLTSDVGVYEAAIKADRANIDNAQLALDYAFITAPVSGRTGVVNAKLGSLAKPGDSQVMVTITQMRPITVAFSVPELYLPRIRAAMAQGPLAVSVSATTDPDLNAEGRLTFVDSAIDVSTGSITLKATFDNADTRLWPGQYVNVVLVLGTEAQALTIPAEAVQTGQTGSFVFVATADGTADLRMVNVDRFMDGLAVIRAGLSAGEKVVVEGQMRLGPGTPILEKAVGVPSQAKS